MPIRKQLKAFWWLVDNRIGGMGRPGFNRCHWFDLAVEEGTLLSWLGKQTENEVDLRHLYAFINHTAPKIAPFVGLTPEGMLHRLESLRDKESLLNCIDRLNEKSRSFDHVSLIEDNGHQCLKITPNLKQVQLELEVLRQHKVGTVISLLEQPLQVEIVREFFQVHHFPVEDIDIPTLEQIQSFTEVLSTALAKDQVVVTHCLAGVGRTTTMLFAAHLLQGHSFEEIADWVKLRNPYYQFHGKQAEFLQQLARDIAS